MKKIKEKKEEKEKEVDEMRKQSDDAEIHKEENAKRGLGRNGDFQRLARFRAMCED